jgi:transcriptional regulator with XRE-family HTH domain
MKHEDIYAALGKRVREERIKAGMTLEELAEASSISASFLAYIEHGKKKASLVTVKKLAEGLQLPLADLFTSSKGGPASYEAQTLRKLAPFLRERSTKDHDFIVDIIKSLSKRLPKKGASKSS